MLNLDNIHCGKIELQNNHGIIVSEPFIYDGKEVYIGICGDIIHLFDAKTYIPITE